MPDRVATSHPKRSSKNENCRVDNRAEDEQYRTFSRLGTLHYSAVKTRELTPKQILSVPCTTCGAAVGEPCELHTGAPRTEPHRDRKLSAAEAVETKQINDNRH